MLEIEVLSAPGCRKCEAAKRVVLALVERQREAFPGLTWRVTDIAEHPEAAAKYGIMSTPAIAINGRLEFTGVPRKDDLVARLKAAAGAP